MNRPIRLASRWLQRCLLALTAASCLMAAPALAAGGDGNKADAKPVVSTKDYDLYRTGNAANVVLAHPPSSQMTVLMGGGLDVDQAFKDMIAKARENAGGQKIDVVVIRASGADGYNQYLYDMGGVDSVESLVIKTRAGANDPGVRAIIAAADMLFIAGGDQWNYINLWNETAVENIIKGVLRQNKVPIGGTSAGLAVLGAVDFSAQYGTITSAEALSDPYSRYLTLDATFLETQPSLGNTIVDAHLVTRDRMGRLVTFLARMVADGRSWLLARAIGVDEQTALVIVGDLAWVRGNAGATRAVYFLSLPQDPGETLVVRPKTPLEVRSVQVDKITADVGGGEFNLNNGRLRSGGISYQLYVQTGVLYGPYGTPY